LLIIVDECFRLCRDTHIKQAVETFEKSLNDSLNEALELRRKAHNEQKKIEAQAFKNWQINSNA
jgi:CMP-N-acetylneuraminic acid synthetase